MSFDNGPKIVTNGLVLALDAADQNSYVTGSTTWISLLGTYSGSLIQSSSFTLGPPQAFVNNINSYQSQSAYLSVTPALIFNDLDTYTLDFWVKLRTGVEITAQSLTGRNSTNPWLSVNVNSADGSSWYLRFRELTVGTYYNFTDVTDYNIVNNWTNITLTADASRNISFYLNGAFRQTQNVTTSTYFEIRRIMGGYNSGNNFYNWQGSMAATKFYNRALSAVEIQQNYNAIKSRFNIT
jgi:hypothetical protein